MRREEGRVHDADHCTFRAEAEEARGGRSGVGCRRSVTQGDEDMKRLSIDDSALARLCRSHRIRRLSLFGSELKGNARPDSDIDLLVEFERDAAPSLFDLATIEQQLSALLGGRRVDLRTPADLSRYFRDEVIREAEVQFDAA